MTDRLVVVLCKPPGAPDSKTRLRHDLGDALAEVVYRRCLADVVLAAHGTGSAVRLAVAGDPDAVVAALAGVRGLPRLVAHRQVGATFARRQVNEIAAGLAAGHRVVTLVGSDLVGLTPAHLTVCADLACADLAAESGGAEGGGAEGGGAEAGLARAGAAEGGLAKAGLAAASGVEASGAAAGGARGGAARGGGMRGGLALLAAPDGGYSALAASCPFDALAEVPMSRTDTLAALVRTAAEHGVVARVVPGVEIADVDTGDDARRHLGPLDG